MLVNGSDSVANKIVEHLFNDQIWSVDGQTIGLILDHYLWRR